MTTVSRLAFAWIKFAIASHYSFQAASSAADTQHTLSYFSISPALHEYLSNRIDNAQISVYSFARKIARVRIEFAIASITQSTALQATLSACSRHKMLHYSGVLLVKAGLNRCITLVLAFAFADKIDFPVALHHSLHGSSCIIERSKMHYARCSTRLTSMHFHARKFRVVHVQCSVIAIESIDHASSSRFVFALIDFAIA